MFSLESDYIAGVRRLQLLGEIRRQPYGGALRHKLVERASENSGGAAVTCRRCLIQNQDRSA